MKSEILGRDIFEVVGFIENYSAVVGKDRGHIGLTNREVRKKQMVIHHNDVGLHRFLTHEREKTSLIVLAFRAQTSLAPRIHAGPQLGVVADGSQFRPIAGFGLLRPIENGLESSKLSRAEQAFGMQGFKLETAEVVIPS